MASAVINNAVIPSIQTEEISGKPQQKLTETQWKSSFLFIQMADCQLGFFDNNVSWEKEKDLLKKAVKKINDMKPCFVILCGDMTHAFPNQAKYAEQVADYKAIVSKIDSAIRLICLCGNHDVGDRPTKESIAAYEANFGPHYFSFWAGGVHCVALNSSLISDPSGATELFKKQMEWLNNDLKESNLQHPKHRFIFTHHSWFLKDSEEPDSHFVIPSTIRKIFLEVFEKNDVKACFSGHYHRNAIGKYKNIEMITTSAVGRPLGEDPSGFRVVHVTEDGIQHHYCSIEDEK